MASKRMKRIKVKTRKHAKEVKSGGRQLVTPSRAETSSALQLLGLALAVVALYTVLQNAAAASGVLGAIGRALAWLGSPDTSIPYQPMTPGEIARDKATNQSDSNQTGSPLMTFV